MPARNPSAAIATLLTAIVMGACLAALAAPGWELFRSLAIESRDTEIYELSPYEKFVQAGVALVVAGIWFYLGACFGSFLNVVVYRLPLGKPLFLERSHCPGCGTQILFRDNLPVVGWLKLGGACRHCREPISIRYPLVEIAVGLFFLVFYFRELLSGGANLPLRATNIHTGIVWVLFYTKWDLLGLYLFHCLLFCWLLAMTLPKLDGQSLPLKWLVAFLLSAVLLLSVNPNLFPLSWKRGTGAWAWPVPSVIGQISCGALLGAGLGWGSAWLRAKLSQPNLAGRGGDDRGSTVRTLTFCGALLGVSLGWQTAVLTAVLGLLIWGLTRPLRRPESLRSFFAAPETVLLIAWPLVHFWWRELATLCFGS